MTFFMLVCACRAVRRWLDELGPVTMDKARITELNKLRD